MAIQLNPDIAARQQAGRDLPDNQHDDHDLFMWIMKNSDRPFAELEARMTDATVTWMSDSNYVYRLQYKTNLTDPIWIDVSGDVPASTNTASKTDSTLGNAAQRLYRVMLLP